MVRFSRVERLRQTNTALAKAKGKAKKITKPTGHVHTVTSRPELLSSSVRVSHGERD